MFAPLRTPTILHLALCSSLATTLIVFTLLTLQSLTGAAPEASGLLWPVAAGFAFLSALGSFFLPNLLFAKLRGPSSSAYVPLGAGELVEQIRSYQSLKIVQWALVEGGGMVCGVVYYLSGQWPPLTLGVALLALLFFHRPTRADFQSRMGLSDRQLAEV